jgi:hypothetical protein
VWAAFRVARRARAHLEAASATSDEALIAGSHDGYRRLPGRNRHSRQWRLDGRSLCIADQVSGAFATAAAHFHLQPQVAVRRAGVDVLELAPAVGPVARMTFEGAAEVRLEATHWCPEFGLAVPNCSVVAIFAGNALTTRVAWT